MKLIIEIKEHPQSGKKPKIDIRTLPYQAFLPQEDSTGLIYKERIPKESEVVVRLFRLVPRIIKTIEDYYSSPDSDVDLSSFFNSSEYGTEDW